MSSQHISNLTWKTFAVGMATILIADFVWLSWSVDRIYRPGMGSLARQDMGGKRLFLGSLAWPLIVIGLAVLVLGQSSSAWEAFVLGCLSGTVTYGVYNLTSIATLREEWSLSMSAIDTVWGTLLGGVTAASMYTYGLNK